MKKVLFYYDNHCGEFSRGGTEVATYRIAKALVETGHVEPFHAYRSKSKKTEQSIYSKEIKLSDFNPIFEKELSRFIRDNDIEVIVNMGRFFRHDIFVKSTQRSGKNVSIIFMQHFAPGSEVKKTTYRASWHLFKLNPFNIKYFIRLLFYPLIKLPRTLSWKKVYRDVYDASTNVVLLSQGYKREYCKVGSFNDESKFVAIPNIFELKENIDNNVLKKEKRVLILSRMDENQKRLSLALKIWKEIEKDPEYDEWSLDIVGDGHNTDIVKRLISKMELNRVKMHGWQPREEFLKRSSILMMTSEYEGLPLSILEAQAYGVVPIAYDSFASLHDVIKPYENGVIVEKFGDIEDYSVKLKDLMRDEAYRKELASGAGALTGNFSSKKIAEEWLKIL